ncbi:FAD-dependent oxidoreductase [Extibacter sp. GGCC_0201]|uniref:FAD-dependent oxidoreductase n=1 Tax=Extibacter sp. GGCC_0201 TaxID=2731209 RepID=UPI001AA0E1C0|nr:FAD-dependent oxidoreductase [Extibacter sp. GGCC_0201]MBO1722205.1 FAD-dependent oxidoreductase [Extibacter sp. GGCC_0201]
MQNKSYWKETVSIPARNPLAGDISIDTVIIGGGMAGILTAFLLQKKGRECIVLEAGRIGCGQTGCTTAKVTSQHNLIYAGLIKAKGEALARQYAQANQAAVREYESVIRRLKIECDWKECPAYLYADRKKTELHNEYMAALRLGIPAKWTEDTELPFRIEGALRFDAQGQFHPMKFLKALSEEVTVYENTKVLKVTDNGVETDKGNVQAANIVFASHYPFVNMPGYYFMRMHQERSYVLAVKGASPLNGVYLGVDEDSLSLRTAGDLLLIGGGAHRTGDNEYGGRYKKLEGAAARWWPGSKEAFRWSAQDCMTLDAVPYIGRFSARKQNWYVATGFQKWGMTSSMVSAMILSDQICGEKNPYEEVFSPQRHIGRSAAGSLIKESGHTATTLAKPSKLPEERKENVRTTRCSHLGCHLSWNPDEKTYECPCHGSRFDCKGRVTDGPAQKDISIGGES